MQGVWGCGGVGVWGCGGVGVWGCGGVGVWGCGGVGVCGVWGCGVWGVGCGVWGVGCGVWGVGCGVWGVGVWCVGCKGVRVGMCVRLWCNVAFRLFYSSSLSHLWIYCCVILIVTFDSHVNDVSYKEYSTTQEFL